MKDLLKRYFGYDHFRPLQEEIINYVLAKKDCFILMPTGGGKSLCYQLPALQFPGLTLVISPLIALMKDQVDSLRACGINAAFINSTLTVTEFRTILKLARDKQLKILYVAPERFAIPEFQQFLQSLEISLIAVDEAHCISEWGHNFRPEYRNLSSLRTLFPHVPMIALTATATLRVREDILQQLHLTHAQIFISSFNRENLHIRVIEKKQAFEKLVTILNGYREQAVIIYCFSRKETEEIAEQLNNEGFNAQAYHAGLETETRNSIQEDFTKDKTNIIVATIAFGMGIDKPDVRLVVHLTYPKTLEGYYQEIGRAGRDGLASECIMFYTYADTRKHEFFINQISDRDLQKQARDKLNQVITYARLTSCRKRYLLKYFGENTTLTKCGSCDICIPKVEIVAEKKAVALLTPTRQDLAYNQELFDRLKVIRKELATRASVPAFVIFGDKALQEMAHYLPQDLPSFSKINGVGSKKLMQFGGIFLETINTFIAEKKAIQNPIYSPKTN